MKKMWTVLRQEYVSRVRNRGFLIGTILLPVLHQRVNLIRPPLLEHFEVLGWQGEGTRTIQRLEILRFERGSFRHGYRGNGTMHPFYILVQNS